MACDSCGYESDAYLGLNAGGLVFGCPVCKKIVNPDIVPFYFLPPLCPSCKRQLLCSERISVGQLSGDDRVICPSCNQKTLGRGNTEIIRDFFYGEGDWKLPELGQIIHARVIVHDLPPRIPAPFLMIPGVPSFVWTELLDAQNVLDGFHKFRVEAFAEKWLRLSYMGTLPPDEGWPDYYG